MLSEAKHLSENAPQSISGTSPWKAMCHLRKRFPPCALYPFLFFLLRKTCSNDAPPANSINTEKLVDRIIILC